jgi:hypothetical protein
MFGRGADRKVLGETVIHLIPPLPLAARQPGPHRIASHRIAVFHPRRSPAYYYVRSRPLPLPSQRYFFHFL